MKIGPKYKIARKVGAPVFEKTQTPKFQLRESKRERKQRGPKTSYGLQMLEKQKAQYTYLLSEKQFRNYVKAASAKKSSEAVNDLYESLEMRLDNVVFRLGFANTRSFAKQMVSHGHILVNGKKVNIPSFKVSIDDKVSIREGSLKKAMFVNLNDKLKNVTVPNWIKFDFNKKEATIQSKPKMQGTDLMFDLSAVLEFYSR
jgi:small subunit ribosomal protein S4